MTQPRSLALKEWRFVCDRLGAGAQTLILRKGGIAEPKGGFSAAPREFFLFPTELHQNAAALRPELAGRFQSPPPAAAEPGRVAISVCAQLDAAWRVADLDRLRPIEPFQALRWDEIERRFQYRGKPEIFALLLRVRRVARPFEIENTPQIEGCKSWVELEEAIAAGAPVLDDAAFARAAAPIREALAGCESA